MGGVTRNGARGNAVGGVIQKWGSRAEPRPVVEGLPTGNETRLHARMKGEPNKGQTTSLSTSSKCLFFVQIVAVVNASRPSGTPEPRVSGRWGMVNA